ncbi:MAG: hypothetical protein HY690_02310 [Chloroflexi bacterium]|nr:hypothetical protein [Chloroflexota bacterium]
MPASLGAFDPEQYAKVLAFWKEFEREGEHPGLYKAYQTPDELERLVRNHLTALLPRFAEGSTRPEGPTPAPTASDGDLLGAYLAWLERQHSTLEVRGIRVVGQLPALPLERVFVALQGDNASPYERAESRELLEQEWREWEARLGLKEPSPDEQRVRRWRFLARAPVMPSLEERDRPRLFPDQKREPLTLGEAFRRNRWLVILGDPGNGKTTLARWLTLNLARALRAGRGRVVLSAYAERSSKRSAGCGVRRPSRSWTASCRKHWRQRRARSSMYPAPRLR